MILIAVAKIINCKLTGHGINDTFEMIMINNLISDKECYVLGIFTIGTKMSRVLNKRYFWFKEFSQWVHRRL